MPKLVVTSKGSIIDESPLRRILYPGAVIDSSVTLSERAVREHLREGFLAVVENHEAGAPKRVDPPQEIQERDAANEPPMLRLDNVRAESEDGQLRPESLAAVKAAVEAQRAAKRVEITSEDLKPAEDAPKGEKMRPQKLWDFDPDGIKGMTLEQLNVLIRERDPSVVPYETVEEAIAHLSQEYTEPEE